MEQVVLCVVVTMNLSGILVIAIFCMIVWVADIDFGLFDFIENSTTRGVVKIRVLWYQGMIESL